MKVVKISKLKNKEQILQDINSRIDINDWVVAEKNSYIIIDNGEIIPAYLTLGDNNSCALTLWVDKEYRGRGYGKFLVNSLNVKYAIVLYSSVSFWESLGFRRYGKKSLYFKRTY